MEQSNITHISNQLCSVPYSVLDLAPIIEGCTAREALKNSLDLAQHAEKWGYRRYWLAEHHNMPGIASSATAVVIGHVASGTAEIRVGSGGIMLPNHASLVIAEQFGTLESLFPGRIDLGLGRAPGTDQLTAHALRRNLNHDDFQQQLAELSGYFNDNISKAVRAIPGEGMDIPIWLLGSSGYSARLAGQLGLPFAFASHFSPEYTVPALELYRKSFKPSDVLTEPYAMVGLNIVAADTDDQARILASSMQQQFLNLIRNQPGKLAPPIENIEEITTDYEKSLLQERLSTSIIGSPETVKASLEAFLKQTGANEIMVNAQIFDHQARLRSYEIVANLMKEKINS